MDSPDAGQVRHRGRDHALLGRQGHGHRRSRRHGQGHARSASQRDVAGGRSEQPGCVRDGRPLRRPGLSGHGFGRADLRPPDSSSRPDVFDPGRLSVLRGGAHRPPVRGDIEWGDLSDRHHLARRRPERRLDYGEGSDRAGGLRGPGDCAPVLRDAALPTRFRRHRQHGLYRPEPERRHRRRPQHRAGSGRLLRPGQDACGPGQELGFGGSDVLRGRSTRHGAGRGPGGHPGRGRRDLAAGRGPGTQPRSAQLPTGKCGPEPDQQWRAARPPGRVLRPGGDRRLQERHRAPGRASPHPDLDHPHERSGDIDFDQLLGPPGHERQHQPVLLRSRRRLDSPHPSRHVERHRHGDQGQRAANAGSGDAGCLRRRHQGRPGSRTHARRAGLDRVCDRNQRRRRILGRAVALPAGRDRPRLHPDSPGHRSRADPGVLIGRLDGVRGRRSVRLLVAHRRGHLRRPHGGVPVSPGSDPVPSPVRWAARRPLLVDRWDALRPIAHSDERHVCGRLPVTGVPDLRHPLVECLEEPHSLLARDADPRRDSRTGAGLQVGGPVCDRQHRDSDSDSVRPGQADHDTRLSGRHGRPGLDGHRRDDHRAQHGQPSRRRAADWPGSGRGCGRFRLGTLDSNHARQGLRLDGNRPDFGGAVWGRSGDVSRDDPEWRPELHVLHPHADRNRSRSGRKRIPPDRLDA